MRAGLVGSSETQTQSKMTRPSILLIGLALLAALLLSAVNPTTAHPGHEKDDGLLTPLRNRPAYRARRDLSQIRCKRQVACVLSRESTEGPYYYNYESVPLRRDIREDQAGIPLTLKVDVVDVTNCQPVSAAAVDIWHTSAEGIYSRYVAASLGSGSGTDNSTFLRGIQPTDSTGTATLLTIFPGCVYSVTAYRPFESYI